MKEKNIIEIQKQIKIDQGDETIILEKGDKIRVLNEEMPSPQYNDYITFLRDITPEDFMGNQGKWIKAGSYRFTYGPDPHTYRIGDTIVQDNQFFEWYKQGFIANTT